MARKCGLVWQVKLATPSGFSRFTRGNKYETMDRLSYLPASLPPPTEEFGVSINVAKVRKRCRGFFLIIKIYNSLNELRFRWVMYSNLKSGVHSHTPAKR